MIRALSPARKIEAGMAIIAALAAGVLFFKDIQLLIMAAGGISYLYIAWRKPIVHLFVLILASVNFLGYINPEQFIRIPGAFKFIDLLFGIAILLFAVDLVFNRSRSGHIKGAKMVLLSILGLTIFQIVFTGVRFNVPIISCFKVGREYLYFFIGLFALRFFDNEKDRMTMLKFVVGVAVVQAVLVLLQFSIGQYSFLGYTKITSLDVGGAQVTRIYFPAGYYVFGAFSIVFWMLFFKKKIFPKAFLIFVFPILAFAVFISYNRTLWMASLMTIIMPLMFFNLVRFLKYVFLLACCGMIMGMLLFVLPETDKIETVKTRVESIPYEIQNYNGNFAVRFEENWKRIDLIKDHFIIGPGFVHADHAARLFNFFTLRSNEYMAKRAMLLQTNDSGIITWMVSYSSLGALWVLYMLMFLLLRAKKVLMTEDLYSGLIVGIGAYIWSVWLTSLTTTGFTYYPGVIAFSVFFFLFASFAKDALNRKEVPRESKEGEQFDLRRYGL